MYYSGFHPNTGEEIFTAKTMHEKQLQKALLQAHDPANRELVREARVKAGLPAEPPRKKALRRSGGVVKKAERGGRK